MERKTLRMFSKIVLLLGLLVVTYTAPVELDESDSQTLRFESDGTKQEKEGSQKHIERKYEDVGSVPIKFHSYSASSGTVGNIFPPWKRGDPEPHPNLIRAHKRMKTDNHKNILRKNLDGTNGTKVVVAAKTNRSISDHLPTPPPMPEHKLHRLLTALKNAGFFAALKRSYFCVSKMNADGRNSFDFKSEDGTKKLCERGSQKQVGPKPEDIDTVSYKSYSFTTSDGVVLTVNWVADENGFQATGDHLPTPLPMPEHKLKYEMNPIDGDDSVIEKRDDGSYSFRVAAKDKLDRNQRILAMLTANLTRTPFSITPPSTGLPTKTGSTHLIKGPVYSIIFKRNKII
ncbi:uncharacterized protein LOC124196409 isoform X2 [Daphnia pulex]|uniref:uncharacterized protein LOC124196409 isoform X2 n=1 Tax=Daphnia pulex TaxID=6669 RepID=UPI001EDCC9E3|nr:uncharacterized protein LOC124196409 isoform X2 [Daphnia pulex]